MRALITYRGRREPIRLAGVKEAEALASRFRTLGMRDVRVIQVPATATANHRRPAVKENAGGQGISVFAHVGLPFNV